MSLRFKNFSNLKYVGGLSQIKNIKNPIKLSANESALGPSKKAISAFVKNSKKLSRYPDGNSNILTQSISKNFKLNPNNIIIGNGSDEIISLACQLFLKPNDEVIVTEYSFLMYRIYAKIHGGKVISAPEDNFKANIDSILAKVTARTKIVFLANPNNPTGTYLDKNEMLLLRKKLRSNILLVVDDAYFEFVINNDYVSGLDLFKNFSNVLITRSFSKIHGLASLRLGWGYGPKNIISGMKLIKPPFNVNSAAQVAGVEALRDKKWLQKNIDHNRKWADIFFENFVNLGILTNVPVANFFLMHFNNKQITADQVFDKFIKSKIILRKMKAYGLPNSLRVTIGNNSENNLFLKTLNKIFDV
ncbi:MAG: histidinol-phosphate transaminase [Candidatus Fonsibacter ubiquis]